MQLYKIYVVFILSFIVDSISVNMEKVLIERYNKVVKKCFDSKGNAKPSYDCSGLITRGIRNGKNGLKYAWSINSARKTFSFAFLRRDQLFNHFPFDYGAGLILYPHLEIPKNKLSVKIRCAFPLDGNTFNRANDGCGQSSGDKTGLSKHCDALGITTIKKWIQTYKKTLHNDNLSSKQCAFDMTKKTAARDFEIACQANSYIRANSKKYFLNNNELLMNAWNVNQPDKLPIQAFFYITTTNNGYTAAKLYQKEYHDLTRGNIPIVGIFLPNTRKGNIMIINAGPCGMPVKNKKIVIHNMRKFDLYGSDHGLWKLDHSQFGINCNAVQIPGLYGHITNGIISDKFFKQIYNIYLTKTINNNHREYYALKDGENVAKKINGLPKDALILAIHNLGGVNYFGSSVGAFKLIQGDLYAHKVPGTAGHVRRVVLGGSANPNDAKFLPA